MKKILIAGGVFAAGSAAQLLCSIVFLFASAAPMVEAVVQIALLLVSALGLIAMNVFLRKLNDAGGLDDRFRGLVYGAGYIVNILLTGETLLVAAAAAAVVLTIPVWLRVMLTLLLIAGCVVAVLFALKVIRSENAENGGEADHVPEGAEAMKDRLEQ